MIIFFVFFVLLFMCFWFPKSKVLAVFVFLFIWQLWGWNSWNGDFDQYKNFFNVLGRFGQNAIEAEVGYQLINNFFYFLGFDFQEFMIGYSLIILGIIFYFVTRSPFPAIFSILYVVVFIMDYVFMRNYMANALFFLFLAIAIQEPKHYKMKAVIVLLIALSFHNTALFYLLFGLLLVEKMRLKTLFIIIAAGAAVLISSWTIFISNISNSIIAAKIDHYATGDSPIGPAAMHALSVASLLLFVYFTRKKRHALSPEQNRIITLFQKINIITLMYLPLYFFIPDFARFFRVLFPIELFFVLYLFSCYKNANLRVVLSVIMMGIYSFLIYQFLFSTLKWTYYPLLRFNLIYSLI